jgi:SPP1 family predicted phage head-tail adaptor
VSIGQFTRRFTVQEPVTADDNAGGQAVSTPRVVAVIWGRLRTLSVREQSQAGALQTLATHRVETHYSSVLASTQRLVPKGWTGPTLEILGVQDPDAGARRELWLDCAEAI